MVAMKSPFPGMDPYLERRWGDFHTRFLLYLSDVMNPLLPPRLLARVQERVVVEEADVPPRFYSPDVHAFEKPKVPGEREFFAGDTTIALAEPIVLMSPAQGTQRSIQITDAGSGGAVVTAIELLSPSNKAAGKGRQDYLSKQANYLAAHVNLLELDWVRRGTPATVATSQGLASNLKSTYHASLMNFTRGGRLEYYPTRYDEPLPRLALPLRSIDEFIPLDLQAVFDAAYERGRYTDEFDYDQPPKPPLRGKAAKWAAERIAAWQDERDGK